jgi:hypothetical protein
VTIPADEVGNLTRSAARRTSARWRVSVWTIRLIITAEDVSALIGAPLNNLQVPRHGGAVLLVGPFEPDEHALSLKGIKETTTVSQQSCGDRVMGLGLEAQMAVGQIHRRGDQIQRSFDDPRFLLI